MIELITTDHKIIHINPLMIQVIEPGNQEYCRVFIGSQWFQFLLPSKELLQKMRDYGT